jgi:hypothetical protein
MVNLRMASNRLPKIKSLLFLTSSREDQPSKISNNNRGNNNSNMDRVVNNNSNSNSMLTNSNRDKINNGKEITGLSIKINRTRISKDNNNKGSHKSK